MVAVVCVPDVVRIGVFRPFISGAIAVVDSDVVAERQGSGLERGGWGLGWGAVSQPGIECCWF